MNNHFRDWNIKIKSRIGALKNKSLIKKSGFFDESWYLKKYSDVAQSKINPLSHFLLYGGFEGRDPGPNFSTRRYLEIHEEVKKTGINPLIHYLESGNTKESFSSSTDEIFDFSSKQIRNQLKDIETSLIQLQSILHREINIPPAPPKHLQVRVVGGYSRDFIESGYTSVYPALNNVLRPVGKELRDFKSILDFGCGCGRAIRALATLLQVTELHGTDIDGEAIEWLNNNYSKFAKFTVAPPNPPTQYSDEKFDLIFGISVLTHLPEDMQFQWLGELNRITKKNGYVILTTHGEKHYKNMDDEIVKIMNEKGFFYCEPGFNYGKSISLPDFYQNAYHSHAYIKREWRRYFEIIEIMALGIDNYQDTVLLQKRAY